MRSDQNLSVNRSHVYVLRDGRVAGPVWASLEKAAQVVAAQRFEPIEDGGLHRLKVNIMVDSKQ